MPFPSIDRTVGNTPLVRLRALEARHSVACRLFAKLESFNPLSSVKDRPGVAMIDAAERAGKIKPGALIVEPTSGNTGIALAFVCARRGYRLALTMPESMSRERQLLLAYLGADVWLTPAAQGMQGAVDAARRILEDNPGAFMPDQFSNPANPAIHYRTTGPEIWRQTGGRVQVFVAGVGTGGTISGAGRFLKERSPSIVTVAVEPAESPVLSGGPPAPHRIQGIGPNFVPANFDRAVVDRIVRVSSEEALETAREVAQIEGILCGISSGAALAATLAIARDASFRGATIVTVFPDTGERYLTTDLFRDKAVELRIKPYER
jgi:cysteine synthase A